MKILNLNIILGYQVIKNINKPNNNNNRFGFGNATNGGTYGVASSFNRNHHNAITLSLIDTSLNYAVKANQLQKVNLIINHPSFDKAKSRIIQALFLSVNNTGIFKVLLKLMNDANVVSQDGKSLFELLFGPDKTNLVKIIIQDSNLNLSKEVLLNY